MIGGQLTPSDMHGYGARAVTPDDDNDLTNGECRDLYIGTAGTLKVTGRDGVAVTFGSVGVGRLGIGVKRVWATGTSADNIVALY